MTFEEAQNLKIGDIIYYMWQKNYDGSFARFKVNGKMKTWKTRPEDFRLPLKRGIYEFWALTPSNMQHFMTKESQNV